MNDIIIHVCLFHDFTLNKTEVIGVFSNQDRAIECIRKASDWLLKKNPKDYQDKGTYIKGTSINDLGAFSLSYTYEYYIIERKLDEILI